jgi:hypothetical protein
MQASSVGERLVFARKAAFITLSGVLGASDEARRTDNPGLVDQTMRHVNQAMTIFAAIVAPDMRKGDEFSDEIKGEIIRLVPIVDEIFSDEHIRNLTQHLTDKFIASRHFGEGEVEEILNQSWAELKAAKANVATVEQ